MATHSQLRSTVMKLLHKLVLDDRDRQLAASLMRKSGDPKLRTDSCEEGRKFAVFMLCVCWHPFRLFLPKLLQGLTFLKKAHERPLRTLSYTDWGQSLIRRSLMLDLYTTKLVRGEPFRFYSPTLTSLLKP